MVDLDVPGQDPSAAAAEFLRLDLLTPVGRLAEETRPPGETPPGAVRTFGVGRVGWPRAEVVARAARVVAPVLVNHWVTPDLRQVREVIPSWAVEQWARLGLDPDRLAVRLADAADAATGARVEQVIAGAADPLTPKGWLPRLPEPERVVGRTRPVAAAAGPAGRPAAARPPRWRRRSRRRPTGPPPRWWPS